jgi:hypothetical protein
VSKDRLALGGGVAEGEDLNGRDGTSFGGSAAGENRVTTLEKRWTKNAWEGVDRRKKSLESRELSISTRLRERFRYLHIVGT